MAGTAQALASRTTSPHPSRDAGNNSMWAFERSSAFFSFVTLPQNVTEDERSSESASLLSRSSSDPLPATQSLALGNFFLIIERDFMAWSTRFELASRPR